MGHGYPYPMAIGKYPHFYWRRRANCEAVSRLACFAGGSHSLPETCQDELNMGLVL